MAQHATLSRWRSPVRIRSGPPTSPTPVPCRPDPLSVRVRPFLFGNVPPVLSYLTLTAPLLLWRHEPRSCQGLLLVPLLSSLASTARTGPLWPTRDGGPPWHGKPPSRRGGLPMPRNRRRSRDRDIRFIPPEKEQAPEFDTRTRWNKDPKEPVQEPIGGIYRRPPGQEAVLRALRKSKQRPTPPGE